MRTWNIPLGISTCRSATCTPHRTRWIRSPSVANAFRECGRTTIRHDTTTLGGGRYHPQGRRQVPRTLSRFAHLEPAQSERIAIAFEELVACPADDIGHLPGWSCHA